MINVKKVVIYIETGNIKKKSGYSEGMTEKEYIERELGWMQSSFKSCKLHSISSIELTNKNYNRR